MELPVFASASVLTFRYFIVESLLFTCLPVVADFSLSFIQSVVACNGLCSSVGVVFMISMSLLSSSGLNFLYRRTDGKPTLHADENAVSIFIVNVTTMIQIFDEYRSASPVSSLALNLLRQNIICCIVRIRYTSQCSVIVLYSLTNVFSKSKKINIKKHTTTTISHLQ